MSVFIVKEETEAKTVSANDHGTEDAFSATEPKSTLAVNEPARELERCKRCGRHYLTAQLSNPYLDMTCGRYHPGSNKSLGTLISSKGKGLTKKFKSEYLNSEVWSCCLQPCVIVRGDRHFSVDYSNGCANHDGKHVPGGE